LLLTLHWTFSAGGRSASSSLPTFLLPSSLAFDIILSKRVSFILEIWPNHSIRLTLISISISLSLYRSHIPWLILILQVGGFNNLLNEISKVFKQVSPNVRILCSYECGRITNLSLLLHPEMKLMKDRTCVACMGMINVRSIEAAILNDRRVQLRALSQKFNISY
ncbi:hypothetical protein L9F63_005320, partial [Diploptera punctata]